MLLESQRVCVCACTCTIAIAAGFPAVCARGNNVARIDGRRHHASQTWLVSSLQSNADTNRQTTKGQRPFRRARPRGRRRHAAVRHAADRSAHLPTAARLRKAAVPLKHAVYRTKQLKEMKIKCSSATTPTNWCANSDSTGALRNPSKALLDVHVSVPVEQPLLQPFLLLNVGR